VSSMRQGAIDLLDREVSEGVFYSNLYEKGMKGEVVPLWEWRYISPFMPPMNHDITEINDPYHNLHLHFRPLS